MRFPYKVAADWADDCNGLCKLAESYIDGDVEVCKDELFNTEHLGILKKLTDTNNFKRLSNCSRFLTSWAALLKRINGDGCGTIAYYGRSRLFN